MNVEERYGAQGHVTSTVTAPHFFVTLPVPVSLHGVANGACFHLGAWAENDPRWELTRAGDALNRGKRVTLQRAAQAEGVGVFAQRLDTESDVLVEGNAEFRGAFDDVLAADPTGESLILHAFFHRTDFQIKNAF